MGIFRKILAQADCYASFFVIENGRKSDFPQAKSLFDVPPYRDFVILIIFHGAISRKIRTELGFELHDTGRSDPRRVG